MTKGGTRWPLPPLLIGLEHTIASISASHDYWDRGAAKGFGERVVDGRKPCELASGSGWDSLFRCGQFPFVDLASVLVDDVGNLAANEARALGRPPGAARLSHYPSVGNDREARSRHRVGQDSAIIGYSIVAVWFAHGG